MTKHEMREAAIERLRGHINHPGYYRSLIEAIVGNDYGELTVEECDKRLIDLLTDDDMDEYIKLPVDANGEPWHVGDVTENGNVVTGMAIDSTGEWYFINIRNDIDPQIHYHYHKPTVEDVLVDYYKECQLHASELGFVTNEDKERAWRDIATTFAAKLREVMAE